MAEVTMAKLKLQSKFSFCWNAIKKCYMTILLRLRLRQKVISAWSLPKKICSFYYVSEFYGCGSDSDP